jgi:hypothetical protein
VRARARGRRGGSGRLRPGAKSSAAQGARRRAARKAERGPCDRRRAAGSAPPAAWLSAGSPAPRLPSPRLRARRTHPQGRRRARRHEPPARGHAPPRRGRRGGRRAGGGAAGGREGARGACHAGGPGAQRRGQGGGRGRGRGRVGRGEGGPGRGRAAAPLGTARRAPAHPAALRGGGGGGGKFRSPAATVCQLSHHRATAPLRRARQVCESGSVVVEKLMEIERYSHVMHISSTVTGEEEVARGRGGQQRARTGQAAAAAECLNAEAGVPILGGAPEHPLTSAACPARAPALPRAPQASSRAAWTAGTRCGRRCPRAPCRAPPRRVACCEAGAPGAAGSWLAAHASMGQEAALSSARCFNLHPPALWEAPP